MAGTTTAALRGRKPNAIQAYLSARKETPLTTEPHAEREPALSRIVAYPGDKRHLMTDEPRQMFGPDRLGRMWRVTHVDYDAGTDKSRAVMRPIPMHVLAQMPEIQAQIARMQAHMETGGN